mmetsp:Transcript_31349/g.41510  ORF Transcript_31349/g.41510 Transcript_31349/m.41510 type:complete len:120 (+) Transcript_31349:653-1012(+)
MNPVWYKNRKYLKGSSTGSIAEDFEASTVKIFVRDSSTGQISQQFVLDPATGAPTQDVDNVPKSPVVTSTGSECRIDNYVSEVFYRVYYSDTKDGLYTIEDIQIEFMIETSLSLDVKFC